MKIIDNKNLDEWLFDYFEGNLKAEEKKSLKSFLHKNPALKADYEAWKMSYVHEPEIAYPHLSRLLQKQTGGKWIKGGLGIVLLAGLVLLYLFFRKSESKQEIEPLKKSVAGLFDKAHSVANDSVEKGRSEKFFSDTLQKIMLQQSSVIPQSNNPLVIPEDIHPLIPATLYFATAKDSLMKMELPAQKIKTQADSSIVKKKKRSKEMKVIKLKNTGL
jgi:hypothetical protein